MARRRVKKRTHVGANSGAAKKGAARVGHAERTPKSMVIRIGASDVGPSVSQLVKDMRAVMEPGTATRLKERKANKLRDYTTMAGPLGVTHLLLFSRSSNGNTSFRLAVTPRGPTMHFKVEKYSLAKDVQKSVKHPKSLQSHFVSPPLLVMNNFVSNPSNKEAGNEKGKEKETQTGNAVPRHLETLATTVFQSLFPAISPQSTSLSTIRRVLLLNREPASSESADGASFCLYLRHYAITTKKTSLSKGVRRVETAEKRAKQGVKTGGAGGGSMPNLGRLDDVAELILDPNSAMAGFTSESEMETDNEIEISKKFEKKVLTADKRQKLRAQRQQQEEEQKAAQNGTQKETENGDAASEKNDDTASVASTSVRSTASNSTTATSTFSTSSEKRSVKLVELGPRLKLRLLKVEEGICEGRVMWHEFMNKTKEEKDELEQKWKVRRAEKDERKRIQKENVERKKAERQKSKGNADGEKGDEDEEMDDDDDGDGRSDGDSDEENLWSDAADDDDEDEEEEAEEANGNADEMSEDSD